MYTIGIFNYKLTICASPNGGVETKFLTQFKERKSLHEESYRNPDPPDQPRSRLGRNDFARDREFYS